MLVDLQGKRTQPASQHSMPAVHKDVRISMVCHTFPQKEAAKVDVLEEPEEIA